MRARGLKLHHAEEVTCEVQVAPHAGAWVETRSLDLGVLHRPVAPHAGAWVETCVIITYLIVLSRAPCGRVG